MDSRFEPSVRELYGILDFVSNICKAHARHRTDMHPNPGTLDLELTGELVARMTWRAISARAYLGSEVGDGGARMQRDGMFLAAVGDADVKHHLRKQPCRSVHVNVGYHPAVAVSGEPAGLYHNRSCC
jgi:hypothetical protein